MLSEAKFSNKQFLCFDGVVVSILGTNGTIIRDTVQQKFAIQYPSVLTLDSFEEKKYKILTYMV